MQITRRELFQLSASLRVGQSLPLFGAATDPIVTPEQFGAVGDGKTNDTAAFAAMTARVNQRSGGSVVLSSKTYLVGQQEPNFALGYAFAPRIIMDFRGCSLPLTILGNGARIRSADGLRFGTFDPNTGVPTRHDVPFYRPGELASPYFAMLRVQECSGGVRISDLELDGNVGKLRIGGPWGDTGWQIGCAGLLLKNNGGPVTVSNVTSHHHAQDGGLGDGLGRLDAPEFVTIEDCQFFSNGRNAWSLVGGVGWTFTRCLFKESARSLPFRGSAPMAGIDFEAEGGKNVADIHLVGCIAEDNCGVGCLHPGSGRTSNVVWEGGRIVGSTTWGYRGGGNSGIKFKLVLFLGALINLSQETFEDCVFSDDPSGSPTRQLYNPNDFIIPDAVATTRFIRCTIVHSRPGVSVNGNWNQSLFDDCSFYSKAGAGRLDVYGHFKGNGTRFIAEPGGTNFAIIPGIGAGRAEDSFSVKSNKGATVTYPPT